MERAEKRVAVAGQFAEMPERTNTWRVARKDLWRYCTQKDCRDMLLSFRLLGDNDWPPKKVIACLYALSNHSQQHYERISIPKRTGGTRILLAPDPLLKYVQRNLLHHVLEGFSLSDSAMAYRRKPKKNLPYPEQTLAVEHDFGRKEGISEKEAAGVRQNPKCCFSESLLSGRSENILPDLPASGIVRNASCHVGKPLVMKLDIRDFFGNITFPLVLGYAFPAEYFPLAVRVLLTSLCCYGEYLPQGAPTSPAISNLVMKPLDEELEDWCRERGISYSRYCDDMTFSGDFDPKEVREKAERLLGSRGFELNRRKTRVLSRGTRQSVTGLVVNDRVQVSAEYRRRLRQELYYCRKFGVREHLGHRGEKEFLLPEGGIDGQRYLRSLLGRVQYVRLTRPEDTWFREAEEWLRAGLQSRDC